MAMKRRWREQTIKINYNVEYYNVEYNNVEYHIFNIKI